MYQAYQAFKVIKVKNFLITSNIGVDLYPRLLTTTQISDFGFNFIEAGVIANQFMFRWIYVVGDPDVAKNFEYLPCQN